jgi:hypothetical protein
VTSKTASLWHAARWTDLRTDPRELRASGDAGERTLESSDLNAASGRVEAAWNHAVSTRLDQPEEVDAETSAALEALGYVEAQ